MKNIESIKFKSVEEYFQYQPEHIQLLLLIMRSAIKEIIPDAGEVISYNMPAFKQNGIICWYAGFKNHIGFYPGAEAISKFDKKLTFYKRAKGSVQFPFDKPLPIDLIQEMIIFRINGY